MSSSGVFHSHSNMEFNSSLFAGDYITKEISDTYRALVDYKAHHIYKASHKTTEESYQHFPFCSHGLNKKKTPFSLDEKYKNPKCHNRILQGELFHQVRPWKLWSSLRGHSADLAPNLGRCERKNSRRSCWSTHQTAAHSELGWPCTSLRC